MTVALGAKGVIECELVSSGARWGRGPRKDIHSSNKARVDSPAWHLVQALATLVSSDGNDPAIEGFAAKAKPLSAAEKKMIADAASRISEEGSKKLLGVDRWIRDVGWQEALEMLASRPTVNIEGLVGGYTGPGRQNHSSRQGAGETRSAARAGHDRGRIAGRAESASGETRVWRYRGQHDRRLRSDQHPG